MKSPDGPVYRLTTKAIQEQYKLAARPKMSGTQDNGDIITVLESVTILFPRSFGRPLCEVNILVENIPAFVHEECGRLVENTLLRYMIAESLIPLDD